MKRVSAWLLLALVIGLYSCAPSTTFTPTTAAILETAVLPTPSPSPLLSATPTSTALPAATATPVPTETPLPTATPAPELPVGFGMPVPLPAGAIAKENAARLVKIAEYRPQSPSDELVSFSPDGSVYAVGSSSSVYLYDKNTQAAIAHLDASLTPIQNPWGPKYTPRMLQLSKQGKRVLVTGDSKVTVYNQDGSTLFAYEITSPFSGLDNAVLSADGKLLVVEFCSICTKENSDYADKGKMVVIDLDRKEPVYTYEKGKGAKMRGFPYQFSPDGNYLATDVSGQIFLWDTVTWESVFSIPIGQHSYTETMRVQFSPDARYITVNSDDNIALWEIQSRKLVKRFGEKIYWNNYVLFSPDVTKIAYVNIVGSSEKTYSGRVFDLESGELGDTISSKDPYYALRLNNDGQVTAFRPPSTSGEVPPPWQEIQYSPGMRIASANNKLSLEILGKYGDRYCRVELTDGSGACLKSTIVWASDGTPYQIMVEKQTVSIFPQAGGDPLTTISWSGMMVSIQAIDTKHALIFYEVWSTPNSATSYLAEYRPDGVKTLTQWPGVFFGSQIGFSPDGNTVAFSTQKNPGATFFIFDLEERQVVSKTNFGWSNNAIVFSPEGSMIANIGTKPGDKPQDLINLFQKDQGYEIRKLPLNFPDSTYPTVLAYSPSGHLIAVGLADGSIQLLNAETGDVLGEYRAAAELKSFPQIVFSPDGKLLAALDDSSTVTIWGVMP